MHISLMYGSIVLLSLFMLAGYLKIIEKREQWFVLLYTCVCVVNIGYFLLSISDTVEAALWANRVSYLGSACLPLCMMMIVLKVCKIDISKIAKYILEAISVIVFIIAASPGYTTWYYKGVTLSFINGATVLVKDYGPLHSVYYVYLFSYLIAMIILVLYSYKKKNLTEFKHAMLLVGVVFINIFTWFIEQCIDIDFEFLSISYIITELFLLLLYGMLQDFNITGNVFVEIQETGPVEYTPQSLLKRYPYLEILTDREMDVLIFLLQDRKRKNIADELSITEHTVKKHTAHIFTKLEVSDRRELRNKLV